MNGNSFHITGITYPLSADAEMEPFLRKLINWIEQLLNIHFLTKWQALLAKPSVQMTQYNNSLVGSKYLVPLEWLNIQGVKKFPVLGISRVSSEIIEFTNQKVKEKSLLTLNYYLPEMTPSQTESLFPILSNIAKVINASIIKGYDDRISAEDQNFGVVSLRVTNSSYGAISFDNGKGMFPGLTLSLELIEYVSAQDAFEENAEVMIETYIENVLTAQTLTEQTDE